MMPVRDRQRDHLGPQAGHDVHARDRHSHGQRSAWALGDNGASAGVENGEILFLFMEIEA
jgi:hypothetical protein